MCHSAGTGAALTGHMGLGFKVVGVGWFLLIQVLTICSVFFLKSSLGLQVVRCTTGLTPAHISTLGRLSSFRASPLSFAFAGGNGDVLHPYGKLMCLTLGTHSC